ncbi:acyl-CoA dehydrogenase family protein [Castellaniella sp. GW247-6E4]|uniref:acyl-CoA dehydrogenase family protein n=1 Tax=Castellaniella sp. GW247-6E4 TaxID=3140380 RepID=UPI003314D4C2
MNFNLTEEQTALHDMLRRFVARHNGIRHHRDPSANRYGFHREAWRQIAELGIAGLPFPEEYGGTGGGAVDMIVVMENIGRGLLSEPMLSTVVLSGGMLLDAGSSVQKASLLPAIAAGSLLLAAALYEPVGRCDPNQVATAAIRTSAGWRLSGDKTVVLGASMADKLIVSARTSGAPGDSNGISLFIVDRATKGVVLHDYQTHDGGRAADVRFINVAAPPNALLGPLGGAMPYIQRALAFANISMCAEAVGIMSALIEITVEFLKTRQQFGKPLASFQALRHRVADMYIAAEEARSICHWAALKMDSSALDGQHAASGAKALVMRSARLVGQEAVQLHGGIGVTDELIVGHYFKRLTVIGASHGDADHHLGRFGDTMLAAARIAQP